MVSPVMVRYVRMHCINPPDEEQNQLASKTDLQAFMAVSLRNVFCQNREGIPQVSSSSFMVPRIMKHILFCIAAPAWCMSQILDLPRPSFGSAASSSNCYLFFVGLIRQLLPVFSLSVTVLALQTHPDQHAGNDYILHLGLSSQIYQI